MGIPAPLGISSPPPPADSAVLTPGLARLLNAALFDAGFEALFRRTPTLAALRATAEAGETGALFGATLPDPALRLSLPPLSDADWAVLRRMPPTESLAQAAREMRRLVRLADHAAPQELPQVAAHAAPASHEGALAGAA